MNDPERCYLVVLEWPEDPEARIRSLGTIGVQRADARQWVNRPTPCVIARGARVLCDSRSRSLRNAGVPSTVIDAESVRAILRPAQALGICPAIDAPRPMFLAQFRNAEPEGFLGSDILLLVRGTAEASRADPMSSMPTPFVAQPIEQWSRLPSGDPLSRAPRSMTRTEFLDIHLRDRRHIRCNARRFDFRGALGAEFGYSDAENTDRLGIVLARGAPSARVDTGFRQASYVNNFASDFAGLFPSRGEHSEGSFSVYSALMGAIEHRVTASRD